MANRPHMIRASVTLALAITVLSLVDLTSELKRMDSVNHEQEAFTEKEEDDDDETSFVVVNKSLAVEDFLGTSELKAAAAAVGTNNPQAAYQGGLITSGLAPDGQEHKQDGNLIVFGMDAARMDNVNHEQEAFTEKEEDDDDETSLGVVKTARPILVCFGECCFGECEAASQGGLNTLGLDGNLIVYGMDAAREYNTVTADDSNTASSFSVFQLTSGDTEIEFQLTYVEFRFELAFMNESDPATEDGSSMAIILRNKRNPIRKVVHASLRDSTIGILSAVLISTNVSYHEKTSTSYPAAVPSEFGHMIMLAVTFIIIMVNSISGCITLNHADTPTHGMQILQHMIRKSMSTCASESDPAAADEDHPNNTAPSGNTLEPIWNVASAAVHHMTGNLSLLLTGGYSPMNNGEDLLVDAGNNTGKPLRVHGSGSVRTESIALDDVWYVPGLDSNLVSTGQLARLGCAITLGPGGCRITMGGGDALVGSARFADGYLYVLDFLKVAS